MARKRKASTSAQNPTVAPSFGNLHSSQPSTSSLQQIGHTRAPRSQTTGYDQHDGFGDPHIEPPRAPSTLRSYSRSEDLKRWKLPGRISPRVHRSPNPSLLSTFNLADSVPGTPSYLFPGSSEPSLSRLSPPGSILNPHSAPQTPNIYGLNRILRTQLKNADMHVGVHPSLEPSSPSSAAPPGGRMNTVIGITKTLLQTASSALKLSPIPFVSQIPDLLLMLLQSYETIDSNNENLKGLNDEIRNAYTTILRPFQLSTGQIPPEVISLFKEFHSALENQIKYIEFLKGQKRLVRVVSATKIAQNINEVKTCINKAIVSFSTEATTLTLLQTIQSSVQSELSRLQRAPAEHTYVKSKSACLPSTRVKMQESLLEHLKEAGNRFVWLRGSPGTGKTAISMSVASTLERQGTLAASFFWDKNRPGTGLDSIERFPSTLARQLARFDEDFKTSLVRHLRQQDLELVHHLPLGDQMKTLLIEPMRNLLAVLPSGKDRLVIILDGLDECGDLETLENLMELVLVLDELPTTFAVLVSCRPESSVVSAWDGARRHGLVVPCEDLDMAAKNEMFRIVQRMVEDGLRDRIDASLWKPSKEDLDNFASACRELPVIASIRIRDVCFRTRRGATLKSEFEYFCNLGDAPLDVNSEYLRILRRAYTLGSSGVRPHIAKKYRLVVGTIIVAHRPLSVYSMSQLFGITEDEIHAILEPIGSIIDPSLQDTEGFKFYHATAKEFITGDPIGNENDQVFFVNDTKGYFLGLPLLRVFNDSCERDVFRIPTSPPLGERGKWKDFMSRREGLPNHLKYAINYILDHLDPAQLFSHESNDNELQNQFHSLLRNNLLTLLHLLPGYFKVPEEFCQFNHHDSIKLMEEGERIDRLHIAYDGPWHLYRSFLLFIPPSSPLYKLYGHLSDPVRVFSISSDISSHLIPLSKASLNAQKLMEVKQFALPKRFDSMGNEEVNYKAEFHEPDVRNGIVTCAALSPDGRYVALGFGSGTIEVVDIDHQRMITRFQRDLSNPPVWIEFIHVSPRLTTEDAEGNVTILSHGIPPVNLGTLSASAYPAVTAVSDDGLYIARVPQNPRNPWYHNMTLISILGNSPIQPLASPLSDPFTPSTQPYFGLAIPQRHMLGFSPGGRYIGAFDGHSAFTWSTESGEFIAQYRIVEPNFWVINSGVPPTCPYLVPAPVLTQPSRPTLPFSGNTAYEDHSRADTGQESDESWIRRPFYDLSTPLPTDGDMFEPFSNYSFCMGGTPLLVFSHKLWLEVWSNGRPRLAVLLEYCPVFVAAESVDSVGSWYGDRIVSDRRIFHRPRSSHDGTRFLLQGQMKAPIIVDMSQIV